MSGQALYRRWRPQTFEQVVGQEHVTRTLRNAVKLDRVAHGYLFCGPRGVAKTSTARILAKAINCLNSSDGEPCDTCDMCRAIAEGTSYDVIEMDAASNGLVDNVRDLRQHVMTHPDQARRKVYILDEAHRMSAPAFDALLKTLEEPPDHVVFILVTSEPDKIPATIVSRCQRFDFRRLAQRGIVGRLKEICDAEGISVEPAGLDLIARTATGSMRDAQSILDQLLALGAEQVALTDVEAILGTAGTQAARDLASSLIRRDQAGGLRLISRAVSEGADPRQFCRDVTEYLRGLLLLKLGGADDTLDVSAETTAEMTALAAEATVEQLLRATKLLGQAEVGWRGTLHFQLPLELAFVEATLDAPSAPAPAPVAAAPTATAVPVSARPPLTAPSPTAPRLASLPPRVPPPAAAVPPTAPAPAAAEPPRPRPAAPPPEPDDFGPPEGETDGQALDRDELRARWQQTKEILRTASPRLHGLLTHVRPREMVGRRLVLEAKFQAHRQSVMKDMRALASAAEQVFGRGLSIQCSVPDSWTEDPSEADGLDSPLIDVATKRGWSVRRVQGEDPAPPVQ
jgi:DNA polymerase-3 subunit gamma/tau